MGMKLLRISAAVLAITGCTQTTKQSDKAGPLPADYRQIASAYLRTSLFDPYSVMDPMIAAPKLGKTYMHSGWLVCTRMNAKNRMGGYVGVNETAIVIQNGAVVGGLSDKDGAFMFCKGSIYEPFPEMLQAPAPSVVPPR